MTMTMMTMMVMTNRQFIIAYTELVTVNTIGKVVSLKRQNSKMTSDGFLCTSMIRKNHQLICIPENLTIIVQWYTSK